MQNLPARTLSALQILQSSAAFTPTIRQISKEPDSGELAQSVHARVRMNLVADALAARVKQFAIRVVKFARTLPRDPSGDAIGRQLIRSATSESANYHAARRARSRREFIAKLGVVAEEADETEHWLDILRAIPLEPGPELDALYIESRELRAIFVQSVRTARRNQAKNPTP